LRGRSALITDCHVHIQPFELLLNEPSRELMKKHQPDFEQVMEFTRSPKAFLKHMDRAGLDRAVLINAAAPDVTGYPAGLNARAANYAKEDPKRLISCGSLHPRHSANLLADIEEIVRLGLRLIKMHPPHQHFYPNEYLSGMKQLEILYGTAENNGIPVMFHTGTSIFPGARNKYADPIYIDDVAVDFPKLKIVVAHGGRPLWMETAFFLVRRHANVYLDISSIPPASLLKYFPRLAEIAHKTMFGSDWPGPGVRDLGEALNAFRQLPLPGVAKQHILTQTALTIWPA
jgi:predicted TIM-barrel fold metal-dependent hydrolase